MPELPEVETVRRTLEYQLLGEEIENVEVLYSTMLSPNKDCFINNLKGQTFRKIARFGKYLFFIFDDYSIISHLRMEGKYFIKHHERIVNHEHIIFYLKSGKTLRYHDVRKFGTMKLVNTTNLNEILNEPELKKLGKEANDESLDGEYLYNKINKLNIPIKTVLLNQEIICGLGNIYVDEVCFLSKLHPMQLACTLTINDCNNIVENSKKTLAYAIECGGTTIRSYTSSLGVTGRFQLNLHVHTKENEPCENCNTKIQKIKVGGRGTYFCYKCQRKNPFVIGLTGGISSGKTAVSNYLKENYQDYLYLDTDLIAHDILNRIDIVEILANKFGDDIVEEGLINRNKLGLLIYNNEDNRKTLNSIIHPEVIKYVKRQIKLSDKKIIFVIVPLLFESGMDEMMDEIWYVYISKEEQIKRLMLRDNIDYEYALKKINSQMSMEEKRKIMSKKQNVVLIDNSLDLCYTYKSIEKLMNEREM